MTGRLLPLARRYGIEALALVLAVVGVADAWIHPITWNDLDKGPEWLVRAAPAALALPLVARRLFPFVAPGAVFLAAIGASFVSAEAIFGTSPNVAILLLAAFVIGLNGRRVAASGLALALVAVVVVNLNAQGAGAGDYVFPAIFLLISWLLGHLWWERGERAAVARRRLAAAELERERVAERAVQDERERIAREMHDVIAHSLSVMTVQAGAVRRLLLPEQEREREALLAVEQTGRQSLTEMRRLLGVLRRADERPELSPQPGLKTLSRLVEQVREAGLPVEVNVEGVEVELPPGVDLSAYRIVQEALTNALRHAGPAHAWVSVRYGDNDVEVEVSNDGRSEAARERDGGQGLLGMRERVALCGGEFRAGPRDGGGFRISARLPLRKGLA